MKSAQGKRSHLARLSVIAAVVLVAVAVLAGPASAATGTNLTAHANNPVFNYGGGTLISAVLSTQPVPPVAVGGQWVRIEQSATGAAPWELLYLVTTSSGAYATGTYSGAVLPAQNTWYRFVFKGTLAYAASTSNKLAIQVKPLLGKPGCPAKIKHGKKFTVKGTLKPAFPAGAKTVTVKAFKMNSKKKWVAYKAYSATNADYKGYTQYKVSLKLTKKGKYRFQAQTTTNSQWAGAVSAYSRTLTVK